MKNTIRRLVGAGITASLIALGSVMPAQAADPTYDLRATIVNPQLWNNAAKTVTFKIHNDGGAVPETVIYDVIITQTKGGKPWFDPYVHSPDYRVSQRFGSWASLGRSGKGVNELGQPYVSLEFRVSENFGINGQGVYAYLNFPGAIIGGQEWKVDIVPRFEDAYPANSGASSEI
ncbi:MAG: hypothetical protein Q4G35_05170 [Propionibacteriaceae bacterium]|nr:hypothetical protein [Propionibacteriaceae bacterium]